MEVECVLTNIKNTMRNNRSALIMLWFLFYHIIEIYDNVDSIRFLFTHEVLINWTYLIYSIVNELPWVFTHS